jgi:pyrimidine-nucleoside phosphorylase
MTFVEEEESGVPMVAIRLVSSLSQDLQREGLGVHCRMHIPTLIERKREGGSLSGDEIRTVIDGFTKGEVPEYQMSALAMAIYFRGMSDAETAALTDAMWHSGDSLQWAETDPLRVDKHSTGGIGDKTSLILAPLLACDGLWVPMISGRGLGITGGTLDKLDSIPGFKTSLSETEIRHVMERVGCVMVGQTANICPADKKLYALRDVTGTVPSIPLIIASIMSKKLAEGLNRLVLDVKYGTGAFMKTREQAEQLAAGLASTGNSLGVSTTFLLTPMNEPLGESAGNALEVAECVRCLQGKGPADLEALTLDLAAQVSNSSREQLRAWLHDGTAWARFQQMVAAQGGDVSALEKLTELHAAPVISELRASSSGIIQQVDAGAVGLACVQLGGGRAKASDSIDYTVGVDQLVKTGLRVRTGDVLLRIHAPSQDKAQQAMTLLHQAVKIES